MNVKYYLVTLCESADAAQRHPEFSNHLVVGMDPATWFVVTDRHKYQVLISSWEVDEGTFQSFDHDLQNAAWETYQKNETEIDD